jgi:NADH dehydrogenase FAD-containing subunit
MAKRVVIVGGGYAGVTLAKALDGPLDVIVVERKDRFYHNVGAMRGYADPAWFEKLLFPYDKLLRRGRVVQDEVATVTEGGVRLTAGGTLEADVVVVATGSRYRLPFKNEFTDGERFLAEARALSAELADADTVTIAGDGPVAVELAGEVSWRYPAKRLRLAGRAERLLAGAENPRLGERLAGVLRNRGVELALGQEAETGTGLLIRAYGAQMAVPCLGAGSRVRVDGQFRVKGMAGVYAIGDAAHCGEAPLTFLAKRQAAHLAAFLRGESVGEYRAARRVPMSVPLGPEQGATQLPLPFLPVAGNWITSRLKGRDLFVGTNRALLNAG